MQASSGRVFFKNSFLACHSHFQASLSLSGNKMCTKWIQPLAKNTAIERARVVLQTQKSSRGHPSTKTILSTKPYRLQFSPFDACHTANQLPVAGSLT